MIEYNFPGDEYWLKGEEQLRLSVNRQNLNSILGLSIGDDEIILNRRPRTDSLNGVDNLEKYKSEIEAYGNIEHFNQLGIKDYLLQTEDKDYHSRQNHSYGTAMIGISYFTALKPFVQDTNFKKLIEDDKCTRLLNLALLLHDVGHLPFSHLMEEVFNDVNWTRGKGKYHRHDDAPLEQLSDPEKEGIKKAIIGTMGIEENEKNEYFELLQDLIAGISGVPFLDAVVNSAIDADKIDYIFRDMKYARAMARFMAPEKWLEDFLSNISLSPEGLVRLNGNSSLCALQLLEERQFLYRALYLRPEIRAFEKIAATVILSWLTSKVSQNIQIPPEIDADLRKKKGNIAYGQLIKEFYQFKNEFDLLINICGQLANDERTHQDHEAKEWFGRIKEIFGKFKDKSKTGKLEELAANMIVDDPFYLKREHAEGARKIARDLYVDYPCWVLIDIVESPRFLPSPKSRRFKTQNTEFIGEQFLVPDEDISKWGKKKSHVSLSTCVMLLD